MKVHFEMGLGPLFGEVIGEVEDKDLGITLYVIRRDISQETDPKRYYSHLVKSKSECTAFIDENDLNKMLKIHDNDSFTDTLKHNLERYLNFKVW